MVKVELGGSAANKKQTAGIKKVGQQTGSAKATIKRLLARQASKVKLSMKAPSLEKGIKVVRKAIGTHMKVKKERTLRTGRR